MADRDADVAQAPPAVRAWQGRDHVFRQVRLAASGIFGEACPGPIGRRPNEQSIDRELGENEANQMKSVEFNELAKTGGSLVDLGAINEVLNYKDFLEQKCTKAVALGLLSTYGKSTYRPHWQAVARLVRMTFYEYLAMDELVLSSRPTSLTLLPDEWIRTTAIPTRVYRESSDAIEGAVRQWETMAGGPLELDGWDTGYEKPYIDEVRRSSLTISSLVANTNNSPARLFFYMEAARVAGVPLSIGDAKVSALRSAHGVIQQLLSLSGPAPAADTIEERLDRARKAFDERQHRFPVEGSVLIPTFSKFLVMSAAARNRSLLDAAVALKASEYAVDFRKYLWGLQVSMMGGPAQQSRAAAELQNLKALAEKWALHLDPSFGVTRETTVLKLAALPIVGEVFESLGDGRLASMSVPDVVLNPKRHYVFLSRLFQYD